MEVNYVWRKFEGSFVIYWNAPYFERVKNYEIAKWMMNIKLVGKIKFSGQTLTDLTQTALFTFFNLMHAIYTWVLLNIVRKLPEVWTLA